jgi:hypothetical protein
MLEFRIYFLFGYYNLPARHLSGGVLGIFSIRGFNCTLISQTTLIGAQHASVFRL